MDKKERNLLINLIEGQEEGYQQLLAEAQNREDALREENVQLKSAQAMMNFLLGSFPGYAEMAQDLKQRLEQAKEDKAVQDADWCIYCGDSLYERRHRVIGSVYKVCVCRDCISDVRRQL